MNVYGGYSKKRMATVITVEKNLLGVIMEIQMEELVGRLITVPSCNPCNREKGNLTGRQYRAIFDDNSSKSDDNPLPAIIAIVGLLALFGWMSRRKQN